MAACVREATDIARQANVVLAFEPEMSNVVDSARKARRLLDEIGSPHLKVTMDPANLFHAGELPRMKEILDEAFALVGKDIVLCSRQGSRPRRRSGSQTRGSRRARLRPVHESVAQVSLQRAYPAPRIDRRTGAGLPGVRAREAGLIAPHSSVIAGNFSGEATQFSEGFSTWSMTNTSTGPFPASSLSPGCRCIVTGIRAPAMQGLGEYRKIERNL